MPRENLHDSDARGVPREAGLRVAVTGGAGQLGTLVLRRLLADPAVAEVVSIDRRPPRLASPRLAAVTCDVRDAAIARHLDGCDAVVHLAFLVAGWAPREEFESVNVGGSRNVITRAIEAGARSIVYASSVAAYGVVPGHPEPIVEETPRRYQADFPYSATKFQVEAFLDELEPAHPGVAIARLRPGILFGAHMDHPLGDALRRGAMLATSDAPVPIVWDEDVADFAVACLAARRAGAYNLVARDAVPTAELARAGGLRLLRVPREAAVSVVAARNALARLGLGQRVDLAWVRSSGVRVVYSSEKARAAGWTPSCDTALDVIRRQVAEVPGRMSARLRAALVALEAGARRGRVEVPGVAQARVHLEIAGPGGGDAAILVEDERARLALDEIPRPPSSTVALPAAALLECLAGRASLEALVDCGAVRVEGGAEGARVVEAILAGVRERAGRTDRQGRATRAWSRWVARL